MKLTKYYYNIRNYDCPSESRRQHKSTQLSGMKQFPAGWPQAAPQGMIAAGSRGWMSSTVSASKPHLETTQSLLTGTHFPAILSRVVIMTSHPSDHRYNAHLLLLPF